MKEKATMRDIAELAGVSQSTVSMILSGRENTSFMPDTVARVMSAAKELKYYNRRMPAPAMVRRNILIISANASNPFYAAAIQGIEREARKNSLNVVICNTYHIADLEVSYLRMAEQMNFAGIIYLYRPDSFGDFQRLSDKIPVVCICDRTANIETDVVELDNYRSGLIAAEHLLSLGHKSIAFLANNISGNHAERFHGISEAMGKRGVSDQLLLCVSDDPPSDYLDAVGQYDYHLGFRLAQDKRILAKKVTALICLNDVVAFGAIDALAEHGFRVPEDFSVIGFDNSCYSGLSTVGLTTVDHHISLFSQTTVNFFLQHMRLHESSADHPNSGFSRFKFECHPNLVIRHTTAAPRA